MGAPPGGRVRRARPPRTSGGCAGSACMALFNSPRNQWCAGSYSWTLCHCSISTIGGMAIGIGTSFSGSICAYFTASRVVIVVRRLAGNDGLTQADLDFVDDGLDADDGDQLATVRAD